MIIHCILTVRCSPENKDAFAAEFEEFRRNVEAFVAAGKSIEIPPTTNIRYVLDGGKLGD